MGSFNFECLLSRLPIGWDDKVRCVLLSEDPWGDNRGWRIASLPLRSKYSDYGYVEDIQGIPGVLTLENLRRNLIEFPVGDNPCHDIAINRTHDLNYLLKSIAAHSRDRVMFRAPRWARGSVKVPKGIPTWRRVEKRLSAAGLTMTCDRLAYGIVRVRVPYGGKYEKTAETLYNQAGEILQKRYRIEGHTWSGDRYWIVSPKEGIPDNPATANRKERVLQSFKHGGDTGTKYKSRYPVRQALIREDVWQGFLDIATEEAKAEHFSQGVVTFEAGIDTLEHGGITPEYRKYFESGELLAKKAREKLTPAEGIRALERLGKSPDWCLGSGPMSFAAAPNDLGATFAHMTVMFHKGVITRAQVNETILDFAELFAVSDVMNNVNIGWEPCIPQGQCRNWDLHAKVCSLTDRVIKQGQRDEDC